MEALMRALNLSAIVMAAGLLISAQAFAQVQKQPTQEGGPSMSTPPGASNNADPNCKQVPAVQK
jgi:hypothetical protein